MGKFVTPLGIPLVQSCTVDFHPVINRGPDGRNMTLPKCRVCTFVIISDHLCAKERPVLTNGDIGIILNIELIIPLEFLLLKTAVRLSCFSYGGDLLRSLMYFLRYESAREKLMDRGGQFL